jgi:hypothetical protein
MADPWTDAIIIVGTIIGAIVIAYVFITDEMGGRDGGDY